MLTFFMGFIHSRTTESFSWFLTQFMKCYEVLPKFVCVYQDAAILKAVENILEGSILILDAYHLNINQLKHCSTVSAAWAGAVTEDTANKFLHELRASPTEAIFLARRNRFEHDFLRNFDGRGGVVLDGTHIPKWFHTLYYSLKEMVADCYNRHQGGLRFLFQGSGYSESSNSNFRRKIMSLGVRFAEVPLEMQRMSIANIDKRKAARGKQGRGTERHKGLFFFKDATSLVKAALRTPYRSFWNYRGTKARIMK